MKASLTDIDTLRLVLLLVPDKPHLLLGDEGPGDLCTDLSANIVRALISLSLFSHIYNRPDIATVDRLLTEFKLNLKRFLAAKRSSTRALVFCLSVCPSVRPWSKLNFSLLGQLMTAYDSL